VATAISPQASSDEAGGVAPRGDSTLPQHLVQVRWATRPAAGTSSAAPVAPGRDDVGWSLFVSEMPVPPAAPDAGVDVEVTADVASDTDAAAEVEAAEVQAAEVEAAEANADVDGGVNAEVDTESGSTADELDGLSSRWPSTPRCTNTSTASCRRRWLASTTPEPSSAAIRRADSLRGGDARGSAPGDGYRRRRPPGRRPRTLTCER
jgi:hypothetical protein